MFGKAVSLIMMFLLVMGTLALVFNVQPVKSDYAWTQTIYIQSDGSIQPPTAPIFSIDNVTYTLTDNITGAGARAISIQRNNTIIDGAGHTLQGINASNSEGIDVTGSNVAIKNMKIIAFTYGIFLDYSSGNTLSGNNIALNSPASNAVGILVAGSPNNTLSGNNVVNNVNGILIYDQSSSGNTLSGNNVTGNNGWGIWLGSNDNVLSGNNVTHNSDGIALDSCSNNILSGNYVALSNYLGIWLNFSSDNTVSGDNIANNGYGIYLYSSSSNTVYHDNFVNNTVQVYSSDSPNVWDNGYRSGGNYWSDYVGTDLFRGASQNVNGSDGIGDSHYAIDANNTDHYPLMGPCGSTVNTGSNVTVYPSQDVRLIFQNVTATGSVTANETPTVQAPVLNNTLGLYYNIKVTASYAGNVTVILAFDGSNMTQQQKGNLTMMQYTPIPGDIQPAFGKVDMRDIGYIARRFGTNSSSPLWDPAADITGPTPGVPDGKIDMRDIGLVARNFGKTSQWINITTYVDTANNVIYGETTHFSLIGIH